jgi:protein-S-isoprenylcysteine O-methyltransferase Ste14
MPGVGRGSDLTTDPISAISSYELSAALALTFGLAWAGAQFVGRQSTYRQGAERVPATPLDRWSYPVIAAAVGGSLAVTVLTFLFGIGGYLPEWVLWVGVAFMVVGIPLKLWSLTTLGRFYGNPIIVQTDHQVIQDGPYRWLRHPATLGALLTSLGMPLILLSPIGLVVTATTVVGAYVYRMIREEAVLANRLGDEYQAYRERTWRLVPWVY